MGGKYINERVASPESVPIHLNTHKILIYSCVEDEGKKKKRKCVVTKLTGPIAPA